jgi:hypothetical protein
VYVDSYGANPLPAVTDQLAGDRLSSRVERVELLDVSLPNLREEFRHATGSHFTAEVFIDERGQIDSSIRFCRAVVKQAQYSMRAAIVFVVRRAANDARIGTRTQPARSLEQPCSAFSFDSDTLSVNRIGPYPAVDTSAIVPNLESVALSGLDEVDILVAVDLAQNDITDFKVVRIRRHNGA